MEKQILEKSYSLQETAKLFKVTTRTMYRRVYAGKIEAFKEGKLWKITEGAIMRYRENAKATTNNRNVA